MKKLTYFLILSVFLIACSSDSDNSSSSKSSKRKSNQKYDKIIQETDKALFAIDVELPIDRIPYDSDFDKLNRDNKKTFNVIFDTNGKLVGDSIHQGSMVYSKGKRAALYKGDKYVIIDANHKALNEVSKDEPHYKELRRIIYEYSYGRSVKRSEGKSTFKGGKYNKYVGCINNDFNLLIKPDKFTYISSFANGKAVGVIPEKFKRQVSYACIIDTVGNILTENKYGAIHLLKGKLHRAKKYSDNRHKSYDKWGYIEDSGNLIIDHKYSEAHPFVDGFAWAKETGSRELICIDNKGEKVSEGKITEDMRFHHPDNKRKAKGKKPQVYQGKRNGSRYVFLSDSVGNMLSRNYSSFNPNPSNGFIFVKDTLERRAGFSSIEASGLIDLEGNEVINPIFQRLHQPLPGYFRYSNVYFTEEEVERIVNQYRGKPHSEIPDFLVDAFKFVDRNSSDELLRTSVLSYAYDDVGIMNLNNEVVWSSLETFHPKVAKKLRKYSSFYDR